MVRSSQDLLYSRCPVLQPPCGQFEVLVLPLAAFLRARPVLRKWMETMRPRARAAEWATRRRRESSDSEDRGRRRQRKRTRIDPVR